MNGTELIGPGKGEGLLFVGSKSAYGVALRLRTAPGLSTEKEWPGYGQPDYQKIFG